MGLISRNELNFLSFSAYSCGLSGSPFANFLIVFAHEILGGLMNALDDGAFRAIFMRIFPSSSFVSLNSADGDLLKRFFDCGEFIAIK